MTGEATPRRVPLRRVSEGLYVTRSGIRVVDEKVFRFDRSKRWAVYWADWLGAHREKRFPTLRAARAWLVQVTGEE